jgi:hypothetical protein
MDADVEKKAREDLVVFSILNDSKCAECGRELLRGDMLRMENERPLCLACADLDHLIFLSRGNVALTRRSRKHSTLSAVVVQFNRRRGRYERQGLLVEEAALNRAEKECQTDAASRERARARAALTREKQDRAYLTEFVAQIKALYPGCPPDTAAEIAGHACLKYSGRVGRSALARELDPTAIELAVRAHIRHACTGYDRLLNRGMDRADARALVAVRMAEVESTWKQA